MQAEPTRFLTWPQAAAADSALEALIHDLAGRGDNRGALAHHERLPERPARYGELAMPLAEPLAHAVSALGIERLYTHQVQAIEALRGGFDTVVVTGTASGKSLCYHLPVFERLLAGDDATALYLFPTKALAQDQLQSLTRLSSEHPELIRSVRAGVYDGDTQPATRRKLRESANLILSNPDMLHQGILPQHSRWAPFLRRLRYVVVDEMHAYRGIFGSHVANVMRRLERIVRHYGGEFRYVLCSATIRSPGARCASSTTTGRRAANGTSCSGTRRTPTRRASSGAARTSRAACCSASSSRAAPRRWRSRSRASRQSWFTATRANGSNATGSTTRSARIAAATSPRSAGGSRRRCSRASSAAW